MVAQRWRSCWCVILVAFDLPSAISDDGRTPVAPFKDVLGDAMIAFEKSLGLCGVIAVRNPGESWHEADSLEPRCNIDMATNCSLSYHQLTCPEDCPFVAPDEFYPCRFTCVDAPECSAGNPKRAFPNMKYRVCDPCEVTGCELCASPTSCKRCYPDFQLADGRGDNKVCNFNWSNYDVDEYLDEVVKYVVLAIVATGVIFACMGSRSEFLAANLRHIMQGRRQRRLSKVHDWNLRDEFRPRQFYNVFVNVHSDNIMGVGLALFYNSVLFMLVPSGLLFAMLSLLYSRSSENGPALMFALPHVNLAKDTWLMSAQAPTIREAEPALLISPMQRCWARSCLDGPDVLHVFARQKFAALGIVTLLMYVLSIFYIKIQKRFSLWFDRRNQTMSDFVLVLHGLPSNVVNEVELKKWLFREIGKVCSTLEEVDLHGVSIGYDFSDKKEEVEQMLMRLEVRAEGELNAEVGADDIAISTRATTSCNLDDDMSAVQSWFQEGATQIRASATSFIIFRRAQAKDDVYAAYLRDPACLKHPGVQEPLRLELALSEPPDIYWENLQVSTRHVVWTFSRGLLRLFITFVLFNLLVIVPWNVFVVIPYAKAGARAGGFLTVIAGILMAIGNGILGAEVSSAASAAGFKRKDRTDIFNLIANTIIVLANTILGIGMSVLATTNGRFVTVSQLEDIRENTTVGLEGRVVLDVYLMLVPGQLFVQFASAVVSGSMFEYVKTTLVQKVIYVWRCLPVCLLKVLRLILVSAPESIDEYTRLASEQALAPWPISLGYDYSVFIVNFFIVFCLLRFVYANEADIFYWMMVWAVFYYVFTRYLHLRVNAACLYSTNRLDRTVALLWGLPLSCLADSCLVWGYRSGTIGEGWSLRTKISFEVIVCISCHLLWGMCWCLFADPFSRKDAVESTEESVDDVRTKRIYSWYNCNPIYTLKSHHLLHGKCDWDHPMPLDHAAVHVRHFKFGKEYLFFNESQQKLIMCDLVDGLEPETWVDIVFGWMDCLSRLCRCSAQSAKDRAEMEGLLSK